MKIENFRKADCTLFRVPPIDLSAVGEHMETALFEAWRQGQDARYVMHQLLQGGQVVDSLVQQIAPALEFQKQTALRQLEAEQQRAAEIYQRTQQEGLQQIERTLGREFSTAAERVNEIQQQAQESGKAYSATQQRLDEIRRRVREKLGRVGGRQGLEKLLEIGRAVTGKEAEPGKDYAPAREAGYAPSRGEGEYFPPASLPAAKGNGEDRSTEDQPELGGRELDHKKNKLEYNAMPLPKAEPRATITEPPTATALGDLTQVLSAVKGLEPESSSAESKDQTRLYQFFQQGTVRRWLYRVATYKVW